jgi:hypothetical protein
MKRTTTLPKLTIQVEIVKRCQLRRLGIESRTDPNRSTQSITGRDDGKDIV